MTNSGHDVVIVGGRCAGSALATFLSRAGASVVMLDADSAHSDQVISTHTIHPPGMDLLDEIGVGAEVRSKSPRAEMIRFEVGGAHLDVRPPAGRDECCPRRYRLDGLLQDAAMKAGAEFHERTRVTGLIEEDGRIAGVRATKDEREFEFRGRLTVGADGRRSTVAHLVGAEEYLSYDSPRGMYWAYWEPPAIWKSANYPYDLLLRFNGDNRRVIFSTDDGQLLIATLPRIEMAHDWRSDLESAYRQDLRTDPDLTPLIDGGRMTSKVLGTVSERFFYRRSAGPGWALVGDAGHHKDPIVGWGISEALYQAKQLTSAILEGEDSAIQRYWRQRDVESLPRFRMGEERGAPGPMNGLMPMVLGKMSDRPDLGERMFQETEIDANPYELMPVPKVLAWTMTEALRGHPGQLLNFVKMGKRASSVAAETKQRRKLLQELEAG